MKFLSGIKDFLNYKNSKILKITNELYGVVHNDGCFRLNLYFKYEVPRFKSQIKISDIISEIESENLEYTRCFLIMFSGKEVMPRSDMSNEMRKTIEQFNNDINQFLTIHPEYSINCLLSTLEECDIYQSYMKIVKVPNDRLSFRIQIELNKKSVLEIIKLCKL